MPGIHATCVIMNTLAFGLTHRGFISVFLEVATGGQPHTYSAHQPKGTSKETFINEPGQKPQQMGVLCFAYPGLALGVALLLLLPLLEVELDLRRQLPVRRQDVLHLVQLNYGLEKSLVVTC